METIKDGAIGAYADFDNRFLARDAKAGGERVALSAVSFDAICQIVT